MSRLGENNEWGGYGVGVMQVEGAFRIDGTNDPDAIHDYNTNVIKSVTRVSAGLFEVTLDSAKNGVPNIPAQVLRCPCEVTQASTVAKVVHANYVTGSYNSSTRKFRIATVVVGDVSLSAYADPAKGDPDDNAWVSFCLRGPVVPTSNDLGPDKRTIEAV